MLLISKAVRAALVAVALVLALPAPVSAAPGDAEFKKGMKLYVAREYRAAVPLLEASTATTPRPPALKALGFSYRQLKQYSKALDAYQRYLAARPQEAAATQALLSLTRDEQKEWRNTHPNEPEPTDAPLEPAASSPPAVASATPPIPAATPPATPAPEPVAAAPAPAVISSPPPLVTVESEHGPRILTWVVGGAAVACVGAGVGLGLSSRSTANEISGSPHSTSEVQSLDDSMKSKAQTANILVGVGIGLAALSAAFFILHY